MNSFTFLRDPLDSTVFFALMIYIWFVQALGTSYVPPEPKLSKEVTTHSKSMPREMQCVHQCSVNVNFTTYLYLSGLATMLSAPKMSLIYKQHEYRCLAFLQGNTSKNTPPSTKAFFPFQQLLVHRFSLLQSKYQWEQNVGSHVLLHHIGNYWISAKQSSKYLQLIHLPLLSGNPAHFHK